MSRAIQLAIGLVAMAGVASSTPAQQHSAARPDEPTSGNPYDAWQVAPQAQLDAAEARFRTALARRAAGDFSGAAELLADVLDLLEQKGELRDAAHVAAQLGGCWRDAGDPVRALAAFEDAGRRFAQLDDACGAGRALDGAAEALAALARFDEARTAQERAAATYDACVQRLRQGGDAAGVCEVAGVLGDRLFALARLDDAEAAFVAGLAACQALRDPVAAAGQQAGIADCRAARGEHVGALEARQAQFALLAPLSEEAFRPDLAGIRQRQARSCDALGRFAEAEALLHSAVSDCRAADPASPRGEVLMLAQACAELGRFLSGHGRFEEAREWLAEALRIERATLPPFDPAVAGRMLELGRCLLAAGCAAEAAALFDETVAVLRGNGAPAGAALGEALDWAGAARRELGENAAALPLLLESLARQQAADPADRSAVRSTLQRAAACLQDLRRADEALILWLEAFEMERRNAEGDTPELADAAYYVGACYAALGDAGGALAYHETALRMRRRMRMGSAVDLAESLRASADCLLKLQRADDAAGLLEEALALLRRAADPFDRARGAVDLAAAWRAADCPEAAVPLLEEALATLAAIDRGAVQLAAEAWNELGVCLARLDRPAEAVAALERAARLYDAGFGGDSFEAARVRDSRGHCLRALGRPLEAQAEFEAALEARRRLGDAATLAASLETTAFGLIDLGSFEQARARGADALAIWRGLYSGDEAALAMALERGARILLRADPDGALALRSMNSPNAWRLLREDAAAEGAAAAGLTLLKEARGLRERAGTADDAGMVQLLQSMTMCCLLSARQAEALAAARECLDLSLRLYPADHEQVGMAHGMVGLATLFLGRIPEAVPALERAFDVFERQARADDARLVQFRGLLAAFADSADRATEVLPLLEDALRSQQRAHGGDHDDVLRALHALRTALAALGRHEESLERAREALAMARRLYDMAQPQVLDALNGVALSLLALQRFNEALPLLHEQLGLLLQQGDADSLPHALLRCAIGNTERQLGRLPEAVANLEAAVAMGRRLDLTFGDIGVGDLADLYLMLGRPADAARVLEPALARIESRREQARDVDEMQRAAYFEYLKNGGEYEMMIDAQLGLQNPAEALRYVERGRARGLLDLLERARFDPLAQLRERADIGGDGALLRRIAQIREQRDACDRAVNRSEHELARVRAASGSDDAGASGRTVAQCEAELRAARAAQRAANAAWFALVAELLPMSRARESAELQRLLEPGERMLVYHVTEYGTYLFIVRPAGERDPLVANDSPAAAAAEISGEMLFWRLDERRVAGAELERTVDAYLACLARAGLAARRPALEQRISELTAKPDATEAERGESRAAQAVLDELERSLNRPTAPGAASEDGADAGWHLFMALFPEWRWNTELRDARRLYIVPHGPLTRLPFETLVLRPAENAAERRYWIDDGPPLAYGPSGSALLWSRQRRNAQAGLSRQSAAPLDVVAVGDPVFAHVADRDSALRPLPDVGVYVLDAPADAAGSGLTAGDVILAYDGRPVADYRQLREAADAVEDAIDERRRTNGPVSVRIWRAGVEQELHLRPGRIVAELAKSAPGALLAGPARTVAAATERSADATRDGGLAPLPGTRAEVLSIARALGSTARPEGIRVLLGDQATEAAVFALAPAARYVHLATHQLVDETADASYSRLALTLPREATPVDNGFLTLSDLLGQWRDRMSRCELVVLSACETQVGRRQRDEAVFAMPIGFQFAGAPSVIASLWRVNDASTAELMAEFYARLAATDGADKLAAFTAARRALRQSHAEPYFWAPFIFIGDPR